MFSFPGSIPGMGEGSLSRLMEKTHGMNWKLLLPMLTLLF